MRQIAFLAFALGVVGCSSTETGTVTFTTWGEEYIEEGIPAGDDGFVDGWSVRYDQFLVAFANVRIADGSGELAAESNEQFVVDNVRAGSKQLLRFEGVEAKAWDAVSYEIRPPEARATLVNATRADLELLTTSGYSLYISGTATRDDVVKSFALGFQNATRYHSCQAEQGGKQVAGVVVANGSEEVIELTTHGDHFFYDRLQGSAGANLATSLRFDTIAMADADDDGSVTADELAAQIIDVELYDPSGLPAGDMLTFMTGLARTVGHFRGEGECALTKL